MERIVPWIGVLSARLDYRTVFFSERSGADIGAGLSTFETRIELPDGVPFCRTTAATGPPPETLIPKPA
ncbi:MAG: hypothetical protein DWH73_04045 [Planctomycetota bacterium]|nr:MAG: hypothetical protein DWH73_04045 [Planctomycetota bacterium]